MRLLALLVVLTSTACASMTERIVADARKGLVWDADYAPTEGGDPLKLAALYAHIVSLKIDVQFHPVDGPELMGAYGRSYIDLETEQRYIRVRQDLSINGSIEVLAHEAAHLHQPPYLSRSQGDVFAEVVAAHVATRLGISGAARTSALWLKQHKPNLGLALELQNEIRHVADLLTPKVH